MDREKLVNLINVASGKEEPDYIIRNAKIIDVYNCKIIEEDIAIKDGLIAGIGKYKAKNIVDAGGKYVSPGFIDGHVHIESSCTSPEEFGKITIPHGTTTIIADPHEIANVCGLDGVRYMINASKRVALDIKMMLPSCVPATPFENAGAIIDAEKMLEIIAEEDILGLGEFMNYPGVVNAEEGVVDKLMLARKYNKLVDGHSPALLGNGLNAYTAALIRADHECATVEEMQERLSRGMYVILRQGSACHNLRPLLKGLTNENKRRCLFCTDDCQAKTVLSVGHIDNSIRITKSEGFDPFTCIQMASLNAAECFGLFDRGAIAPGKRADLVFLEDLESFNVTDVYISGELVAQNGKYLKAIEKYDPSITYPTMGVKEFSKAKLELKIKSDKAHVIGIVPGGVVTEKLVCEITKDQDDNFIFDEKRDIAKIAVIERHHNTGNVGVGLIKGYGIKTGAVALSIAHDSHNIIAVGVSDEEIEVAVNKLVEQRGGIVVIKDKEVLSYMKMPIAGLMSDQSGEFVSQRIEEIHEIAHNELGVSREIEAVMTLCFMALPVIPELKLTDMGLFDVTQFDFLDINA